MPAANSPRKAYSRDLTDAQWAVLEPMFPPNSGRGRRQTHARRDIIDAIFYINANGCTWADLPHDFPPSTTVNYHSIKWAKDGTWVRANDALRAAVRVRAGRAPQPSAGVLDSQTTTAAPTGGYRGYDGGKKTTGRKRHILVDTLGLLIAATATAASVTDAGGAVGLLRPLTVFQLPRLAVIDADGAYHRDHLYRHVAAHKWFDIRIVSRPAGTAGFVVLPKRWVVERTFGWLAHHRRHARDYERTDASSEAPVYISHARLMLRSLTKPPIKPEPAPAMNALFPRLAA